MLDSSIKTPCIARGFYGSDPFLRVVQGGVTAAAFSADRPVSTESRSAFDHSRESSGHQRRSETLRGFFLKQRLCESSVTSATLQRDCSRSAPRFQRRGVRRSSCYQSDDAGVTLGVEVKIDILNSLKNHMFI